MVVSLWSPRHGKGVEGDGTMTDTEQEEMERGHITKLERLLAEAKEEYAYERELRNTFEVENEGLKADIEALMKVAKAARTPHHARAPISGVHDPQCPGCSLKRTMTSLPGHIRRKLDER